MLGVCFVGMVGGMLLGRIIFWIPNMILTKNISLLKIAPLGKRSLGRRGCCGAKQVLQLIAI